MKITTQFTCPECGKVLTLDRYIDEKAYNPLTELTCSWDDFEIDADGKEYCGASFILKTKLVLTEEITDIYTVKE